MRFNLFDLWEIEIDWKAVIAISVAIVIVTLLR